MLRLISPCVLRSCAGPSRSMDMTLVRPLSTPSGMDFSHERPAPEQLEHVQRRIVDTVPLMFRQRMDYTFYRNDVFCDDQIFRLKKHGLDELRQHFGRIATLGQLFLPHVEMETISAVPMLDDGTVRCRWRVKYVSFPRLFGNLRLFRREYRLANLSWFDGYSVLTVDGNGHVYKITLQKTRQDESALLGDIKTAKEKLKQKIAQLNPSPPARQAAAAAQFLKIRNKRDEKKQAERL